MKVIKNYIDERRSKGISENTLQLEETYIVIFHAFLNSQYKKRVEYHEIRPSDVRDFLDQESVKNSDSTLIRKIGIIKNWFDFLWRNNKIPVDYMSKFKYHRELVANRLQTDFSYEYLLSVKSKLLASNLSLTAKVGFILLLKGLRVREIQEIILDDITEGSCETVILINRDTDKEFTITFDTQEEVDLIFDAKAQAIFRGVPYLLSSKSVGQSDYSKFKSHSMQTVLASIGSYLGRPVKAETIRKTYLIYLAEVKNYTTDDFVNRLGFKWESAAAFKKSLLESQENNSYNKEQAL